MVLSGWVAAINGCSSTGFLFVFVSRQGLKGIDVMFVHTVKARVADKAFSPFNTSFVPS